ncbi:MAG TPA: hypothetical protein VLY85_02970, partial [Thermoplasmata archaeon]|nr:hypothetical protein [Thermoplasmata archaeon]
MRLTMELVTTWYGAFLVDEGRIVRELRFPEAPAELAGRMRMRRDGHLAPEEERLIEEGTGAEIESRDRRLESMGVRGPEGPPVPLAAAPPPGVSLRD